MRAWHKSRYCFTPRPRPCRFHSKVPIAQWRSYSIDGAFSMIPASPEAGGVGIAVQEIQDAAYCHEARNQVETERAHRGYQVAVRCDAHAGQQRNQGNSESCTSSLAFNVAVKAVARAPKQTAAITIANKTVESATSEFQRNAEINAKVVKVPKAALPKRSVLLCLLPARSRVSTSDALVKLKEISTPADIISPRLVNGTKTATNVMKAPEIKVPHQSVCFCLCEQRWKVKDHLGP